MTFREKRRLSRRIERGLNQLYQAHKRARAKAKKLLAAQVEMWKEGID